MCRAWSESDLVLSSKDVLCTINTLATCVLMDLPLKLRQDPGRAPAPQSYRGAGAGGVHRGSLLPAEIAGTPEPLHQQKFYWTSENLSDYFLNPQNILARNPLCESCNSTECMGLMENREVSFSFL